MQDFVHGYSQGFTRNLSNLELQDESQWEQGRHASQSLPTKTVYYPRMYLEADTHFGCVTRLPWVLFGPCQPRTYLLGNGIIAFVLFRDIFGQITDLWKPVLSSFERPVWEMFQEIIQSIKQKRKEQGIMSILSENIVNNRLSMWHPFFVFETKTIQRSFYA